MLIEFFLDDKYGGVTTPALEQVEPAKIYSDNRNGTIRKVYLLSAGFYYVFATDLSPFKEEGKFYKVKEDLYFTKLFVSKRGRIYYIQPDVKDIRKVIG